MALDPGMHYYLPRHAPFFALPSSRKRPKTADNNEYVISRGSAPPRGTPGTTPKHVDGFDRNYVCPCRAHRYRTPTTRMAPDTTTLTTSLYHHRTASMLDTPTMKGLVDVSTINSQSTVSQSQHNRAQLPTSKKPAAVATKEDMRRAGIHAGYCCKNWDPSEAPLILLGSVFDANSFGKWVYDWTVFHEGPTTPLAEMAGELWLLLIQLAGRTKQAEETIPKSREEKSEEMLKDFFESGVGLWSMLFDANCYDILHRPTA
jgi:hypothetical protein